MMVQGPSRHPLAAEHRISSKYARGEKTPHLARSRGSDSSDLVGRPRCLSLIPAPLAPPTPPASPAPASRRRPACPPQTHCGWQRRKSRRSLSLARRSSGATEAKGSHLSRSAEPTSRKAPSRSSLHLSGRSAAAESRIVEPLLARGLAAKEKRRDLHGGVQRRPMPQDRVPETKRCWSRCGRSLAKGNVARWNEQPWCAVGRGARDPQ